MTSGTCARFNKSRKLRRNMAESKVEYCLAKSHYLVSDRGDEAILVRISGRS
jgi:hypothetical protein